MPFVVDNILHGACQVVLNGTNVGFTKDGVKLRQSSTFLDIDADQASGTIRKDITAEKMMVVFDMLEAIPENIIIALRGASAGSGDVAFGTAAPQTVEYTLSLVGPGPAGKTRTYTFYRAVKVDDTEHIVGSRGAIGNLPVVFELLKDPDVAYSFGYFTDAP